MNYAELPRAMTDVPPPPPPRELDAIDQRVATMATEFDDINARLHQIADRLLGLSPAAPMPIGKEIPDPTNSLAFVNYRLDRLATLLPSLRDACERLDRL